jgi:hypothetical protein
MPNCAGPILLALTLLLSSFLSYWLVWTLNGPGKSRETSRHYKRRTKGERVRGRETQSRRLA